MLRRVLLLHATLMTLGVGPALAQSIEIAADSAGTTCFTEMTPGQSATLYILYRGDGETGATAAEFRVQGLEPNLFVVSAIPSFPLTIGDPFTLPGVTIAFAQCLNPSPDEPIVLFTVHVFTLVADETVLEVVPLTPPSDPDFDCPRIVQCDPLATACASGGRFVVNPQEPIPCSPPTGPPDCSGAVASIETLWPPDYQMRAVEVLGVTDPDGDPVTIQVTGVTSDEPTEGRGLVQCPDARIEGGTAYLRAERAPHGNGRVYTVLYTATDPSGQSCAGEIQVCVPRSLNETCVDDGQNFDATTCVAATSAASDTPKAILFTRDSSSQLGIQFTLEKPGYVNLAVYDLRGRMVRRLLHGHRAAGEHTVYWNGRSEKGLPAASGVYFFKLQADGQEATGRSAWAQ